MNRYDGWVDDWRASAVQAMQNEPTYFYYWDRVKTGLLITASLWLGYVLVKGK